MMSLKTLVRMMTAPVWFPLTVMVYTITEIAEASIALFNRWKDG